MVFGREELSNFVLREYDKEEELYTAFTLDTENLIKRLIAEKNFIIQKVSPRTKSRDSLQGKLVRGKGKYRRLADITDISGVRIVTYFADDVGALGKMIESEFDVDWENSIDKRVTTDPSKFGYSAKNYVVRLSGTRLKLPEYKKYSGRKVEIQVCSALQHTWAEIEHDLGYKTEQPVPHDIRRRFSRLASLLDLADDEFISIRKALEDYESYLQNRISEFPDLILIDPISLRVLAAKNPLIRKTDEVIAVGAGSQLVESQLNLESLVSIFNSVNVRNVSQLLLSFEERRGKLSSLKAARILASESGFSRGISLQLLGFMLLAEHAGEEGVTEALQKEGGLEEGKARALSDDIVRIFKVSSK